MMMRVHSKTYFSATRIHPVQLILQPTILHLLLMSQWSCLVCMHSLKVQAQELLSFELSIY